MFTLHSSTKQPYVGASMSLGLPLAVGKPVCLFRDLDPDVTKGARSWGGAFLSGHSTSLKGVCAWPHG